MGGRTSPFGGCRRAYMRELHLWRAWPGGNVPVGCRVLLDIYRRFFHRSMVVVLDRSAGGRWGGDCGKGRGLLHVARR